MHRVLAAICLAVAPLVALGTIYKVRMPDGSILFTDSPPAGGKIIEEREAKPTPAVPLPKPSARPASGAAAAARPATPAAVSPPRTAEAVPQTLDAAIAEISEAERQLDAARRRLEEGREPLPGERIGTAKGGSRLTPEYERRIALLEREVAEAEARAKRAYDARNALR